MKLAHFYRFTYGVMSQGQEYHLKRDHLKKLLSAKKVPSMTMNAIQENLQIFDNLFI